MNQSEENENGSREDRYHEYFELHARPYVGSDAVETVTAVPADDERFDGVELWQTAFEELRQLVRAGETSDQPEFGQMLVYVPREDPEAQRAEEVYEALPTSGPHEDYPDGKYVELHVDGQPVAARFTKAIERQMR